MHNLGGATHLIIDVTGYYVQQSGYPNGMTESVSTCTFNGAGAASFTDEPLDVFVSS